MTPHFEAAAVLLPDGSDVDTIEGSDGVDPGLQLYPVPAVLIVLLALLKNGAGLS